jgi:hypothetical protein
MERSGMMDLLSYKLGKKAGGGGGATSWDNITDKPSYLPVIDTSSVDILPETQLIYDEGGQQFFYMDPIEGIKVGNTYIITYNGVEYTCEAMDLSMSGMPCIALGSLTEDENGPPFGIVIMPPEMVAEMGAGLMMVVLDGATEATLAIRDAVTYTKKLDNNCLDLDWMPIKKTRPHLEEMVVAHEAVIGNGDVINNAFSYEVSFDGVAY